jgi:hypothetical protein
MSISVNPYQSPISTPFFSLSLYTQSSVLDNRLHKDEDVNDGDEEYDMTTCNDIRHNSDYRFIQDRVRKLLSSLSEVGSAPLCS